MEKGPMIGRGMTAEVFEWGTDKVLKLYYERYPVSWIEEEAKVCETVLESGIPSPKVYEIVEVQGRMGLVYERVDGHSMLKGMISSPWKIIYFSRKMAQLHYQVHRSSAINLPQQRDSITKAIHQSLTFLGDNVVAICEYLTTLPEGKSICHGDFHPDNILLASKDMRVIDWSNANCGNPLFDVARTSLLLQSPAVPPGTPFTIKMLSPVLKRIIRSAYLKEYIRLSGVRGADIDAWILPAAAARLREKVPGEEKWLLNMVHTQLHQQE
jgi:uncharacterized protein (TIGR02172 family)